MLRLQQQAAHPPPHLFLHFMVHLQVEILGPCLFFSQQILDESNDFVHRKLLRNPVFLSYSDRSYSN